jgi:hypothetical protein
MREFLSLVASLTGAAAMTALAIIIHPESPFWKWVLWIAIGAFVASTFALLVDLIWPGGRFRFLIGMGIGAGLFVVCAVAFFFEPSTRHPGSKPGGAPPPTHNENASPQIAGCAPFSGVTEFDGMTNAAFAVLVNHRTDELREFERSYHDRLSRIITSSPNESKNEERGAAFQRIAKQKQDIETEREEKFKLFLSLS